jgi:osmotically-inducible protein OsmY
MKKHSTPLLAAIAIAIAASMLTVACNKLPEPATTTAPMPEAPMAASSIPDVDVTEHVKMALLQSESLKGTDITVATTKGDVRLTGTVTSQTQLDEAVKIARGSDGAHAVHNELTIKQ